MSLANILWAVVVILVILWLLGWLVGNIGPFVHILIVIAVIVLLYNLFVGGRARLAGSLDSGDRLFRARSDLGLPRQAKTRAWLAEDLGASSHSASLWSR